MERSSWRIVPFDRGRPFQPVRVRHDERIQRVVRHLLSHEYVAVLGSPLSEKTLLLQDVAAVLQGTGWFQTAQLNLADARTDDEAAFFASLAGLVARSVGLVLAEDQAAVATARDFQNFLAKSVQACSNNLALFVDDLQTVPEDLAHRLLVALRALYMERARGASRRLDVVIAGGMLLAGYAIGPTSPFNMARRVPVPPLSEEQSQALALATLAACDVPASPPAIKRLLAWAAGDGWLLPWLCTQAAEAAKARRRRQVTAPLVDRAARQIFEDEEAQAPFREAMPILEEDPDTVLDVLQLLKQLKLPRNNARQPITRTGIDRLQLSGAVILLDGSYQIKNLAFQQALAAHFTPGHASRVLRMNGRWRDAIDYLAPLLTGDGVVPARGDLLEAIVQSIYAADSLKDAYAGLVDGLKRGFGLESVRVYGADTAHGELRRVHPAVLTADSPASISLASGASVEVQAFQAANYVLRRGPNARRLVAPLVAGRRAIGVISIEGYITDIEKSRLPSDLPELLRFLRHAAAAIHNVTVRAAYREIGKAVLDAAETGLTLNQVLSSAANALGSDFALLYLVDANQSSLETVAGAGWWPGRTGESPWEFGTRYPCSSEHPAARALVSSEPVVVGAQDPVYSSGLNLPLFAEPAFRVYLALRAGGTPLGVLEIGYHLQQRFALSQEETRRLVSFGEQVAIAVHNARLLQRTDDALARHVQELEMLQDVGLAVSDTLDVDVVLSRVIGSVRKLFPETEAAIWRYDSARDDITLLLTSLPDPAYRSGETRVQDPAWQAVHQGSAFHVPDLSAASAPVLRQLAGRQGLNGALALPLVSHEQIWGALTVFTRGASVLAQPDRELLVALAIQAALALENAEAYKQLDASRRREMYYLTNHVLLHRLGNAVGDVPYQLSRIKRDADNAESLEHIERRVASIISLLLPFRRLVNLGNMSQEPLDVCQIVEEAAERAIPIADFTPDLNLPPGPLLVNGNRDLLRDALQCVIENAWEAMEGQAAPVVDLVRTDGNHVAIRVRDSGPGIPASVGQRVFELGYTTKSSSLTRERGHGLFVTQAVVREHGGLISFESIPGGGTTFTIMLPLVTTA